MYRDNDLSSREVFPNPKESCDVLSSVIVEHLGNLTVKPVFSFLAIQGKGAGDGKPERDTEIVRQKQKSKG